MDLDFTAELWVYQGKAAWHFVTLPADTAAQVRLFASTRRGFGSVRVKARIGQTEWKTSIFPDKSSNSFLLPIKAEVRHREKLASGQSLSVSILVGI